MIFKCSLCVRNINVIERNGWKNPALLYKARTEFRWFINIYKHKKFYSYLAQLQFPIRSNRCWPLQLSQIFWMSLFVDSEWFEQFVASSVYFNRRSLLLNCNINLQLFNAHLYAYPPQSTTCDYAHKRAIVRAERTRYDCHLCVYPFHMLWRAVIVLRPEISVRDTVTVRITSSKRLKHASLVNARLNWK